MLKVGVVGSRRRNLVEDRRLIEDKLDELLGRDEEGLWLVSGGCKQGADRFAEEIARERRWPITIFYANWAWQGRAAGPIRNTHIANECDVLVACVAEDRTGGTEDTVRKAELLGKEVILI